MGLTELLEGVRVIKLYSSMYGKMVLTQDLSVRSIQYDSRRVKRDDLFVAITGEQLDGHRFIDAAIGNGAIAVVMEDDAARPDSFFMHSGVVKIVVPDSRMALARMSANFYRHPSRRLRLLGVTGTNGKTTTTHLIKSVLEAAGEKVGLIGTIEYRIGNERVPATHTTPESLELNALLENMVEQGCTSAVMEVSSHSLAMHRVQALEFSAGVFTNLTQDHLDFHGTMDKYFNAKKTLFDILGTNAHAVTNVDDPRGLAMIRGTAASTLTYGVEGKADVTASGMSLSVEGTRFRVHYGSTAEDITSSLTGGFNVYNILAAYATGLALSISAGVIRSGIGALQSVRGRFEQIHSPQGWTAVVDYAHTPDALEHCLQTIRDIMSAEKPGKIITIFGCGGNRDRGKRPLMGGIASRLSDVVVITSDNPRHEEPECIIEEIRGGVVPGKTVYAETDRRTAIRKGLGLAGSGDVVLVAGKGHEDYQVIGDSKIHFDDREEVEAFLRSA